MAAINLAKVAKFCDTAKPRAHFAARQRHPAARFLTRRIEYFRPTAPSLANTRKSEPPDKEAHTSKALPQTARRGPFLPLYGANRREFSPQKCPSIEISMGWIGQSMGWKSKSMGWIDGEAPSRRLSNAKRRTKVAVRFNGLPYSAHGVGGENRTLRPQGRDAT